MIDGKVAVAVCIPVAGARSETWWAPLVDNYAAWMQQGIVCELLTATSGMLDMGKDIALDQVPMIGKNTGTTSENRNALVGAATDPEYEFDYVFFIDHDTVPPGDVLPRLLAHNRPFVCGVYYHRNEPHLPLMYRKKPNGLYTPIRDFERGALFEVDATGMGVALIHMDVFRAIKANYKQFERWNGSRVLVHKDDIKHEGLASRFRCDEPTVWQNGQGIHQVLPLREVHPDMLDLMPFPYFEMENLRTEDIGFCEKAIRCGYTPVVDTAIEAFHWHDLPISGDMFRTLRRHFKRTGSYTPEVAKDGIQ